jgi:hypothetical protein
MFDTLEFLARFNTDADRDGSRAGVLGALRKIFKTHWKGQLDTDTFRECALLLCEIGPDPVIKKILFPFFFFSF